MKNAFRISCYRYFDDKVFEEHLKVVKKYIHCIDEIAMFDAFSHHGYWSIEREKEITKLIAKRILAYRKAGVKSVGINVIDTIGHLEEGWDVLDKPYMQTMVGADGSVSNSCLCVNTDEYRSYIAERYTLFAKTKPNFIWVDDDMRIGNHGVAGPCYCENCIAKFNKVTGRTETFESLTKTNDKALKELWMQFHTDCLNEICEIIEKAVHSVDENIEMGLMSGNTADTKWFKTLKAKKGRPGAGFYNDSSPADVARKYLDCEYQLDAMYPSDIEDLQYEFENFPYPDYGKSKAITKLENLYALFSGCNGIAYNAIYFSNNEFLLDIVEENNSQWKEIVKRTKNSVNNGVCTGKDFHFGKDLLCLGVPATSAAKDPSVVVLNYGKVSALSDKELQEALSKAAFVTLEGLELIEKRGFAHLCGVTVKNVYSNGVYERFTNDEINGKAAGGMRNSFVNFFIRYPRIATLNTESKTRVLSKLYDLLEKELGPCFTVYENELGGKVAVMTYLDSSLLGYKDKRIQMLNAFEYISGGLPIRVLNDCRVAPVLRKTQDGGFIGMLANMDFDIQKDLEVEISTEAKTCSIINSDGSLTEIPVTCLQNNKKLIKIEKIEPWSAVVITDK